MSTLFRKPLSWALTLGFAALATTGCADPVETDPIVVIVALPLTVEILSGPDEMTEESSANFTFACNRPDECVYECRLGSQPLESCVSPKSYQDLSEGPQQFEVIARNAGGQVSEPAQWSWVIGKADFDIVFTAVPDATTADTWATFAFECSGGVSCSFECALEQHPLMGGQNRDWQACTSPYTVDGLEAATYEFFVQGNDGNGNFSIGRFTWEVQGLPDCQDVLANVGRVRDSDAYLINNINILQSLHESQCERINGSVHIEVTQESLDGQQTQWLTQPYIREITGELRVTIDNKHQLSFPALGFADVISSVPAAGLSCQLPALRRVGSLSYYRSEQQPGGERDTCFEALETASSISLEHVLNARGFNALTHADSLFINWQGGADRQLTLEGFQNLETVGHLGLIVTSPVARGWPVVGALPALVSADRIYARRIELGDFELSQLTGVRDEMDFSQVLYPFKPFSALEDVGSMSINVGSVIFSAPDDHMTGGDALRIVRGDMIVNAGFSDIDGFNALERVEGDLRVVGPNHFSGFNALTHVETLRVTDFWHGIRGFALLQTIKGSTGIIFRPGAGGPGREVLYFDAFQNLERIEDGAQSTISLGPLAEDVDRGDLFPSLTHFTGESLTIGWLSPGMNALVDVTGTLRITNIDYAGLDMPRSITGFQGLRILRGDLSTTTNAEDASVTRIVEQLDTFTGQVLRTN